MQIEAIGTDIPSLCRPLRPSRLDHLQHALADINGWIYRYRLMALADWLVPHILLEQRLQQQSPPQP